MENKNDGYTANGASQTKKEKGIKTLKTVLKIIIIVLAIVILIMSICKATRANISATVTVAHAEENRVPIWSCGLYQENGYDFLCVLPTAIDKLSVGSKGFAIDSGSGVTTCEFYIADIQELPYYISYSLLTSIQLSGLGINVPSALSSARFLLIMVGDTIVSGDDYDNCVSLITFDTSSYYQEQLDELAIERTDLQNRLNTANAEKIALENINTDLNTTISAYENFLGKPFACDYLSYSGGIGNYLGETDIVNSFTRLDIQYYPLSSLVYNVDDQYYVIDNAQKLIFDNYTQLFDWLGSHPTDSLVTFSFSGENTEYHKLTNISTCGYYPEIDAFYLTGVDHGDSIGYTRGFNVGRNQGYQNGVDSVGGFETATSWLGTMFQSVGSMLNLTLFGNITIGSVLMIPLIFGVLFMVFKLVRGG